MTTQALQPYYREKNPLPVGATLRERLASVGLTPAYLQEQLNGGKTKPIIPGVTLTPIPIYESVSAGTKGNLVMEDAVYTISLPKTGDPTIFGVKVRGNSMSPKINDGDIVLVSERQEVMNNDYAIVLWNDGENALRTVTYSGDNVILTSENSQKYPPRIVPKKEIHRLLRVVMRIEKF